jgi:hypothetical protein
MFTEKYKTIKALFAERFVSHQCQKNTKIEWPKGFGVYVVWENHQSEDNELLYIGMTGKYKKTQTGGYAINSGKFSNRKNRWTPYFFQESNESGNGFFFKHSPKYSNSTVQFDNRFESDAYSIEVCYSKLRIDFFTFSADVEDNFGYTPTLLEAKLLTEFLIENKTLPPANFEI